MRETGFPQSANGASSFHLWWEPPPPPAREVSVTLTIDQEPAHARLVFWALQVEFGLGSRIVGGAHLGLQWNARHPGSRAVNWGGYDRTGAVLAGSPSPLGSTPGDPNTRDFDWSPKRAYRLSIRAGAGGWVGEVTDEETGHHQFVRELYAGADALHRPVVWSEVFARCDDPTVSATWRDPVTATGAGRIIPRAYRVSYQDEAAGGCSNTDVVVTAGGVRQSTAVTRRVPPGALVAIA